MLDIHRETFARFGYHIPGACWTTKVNGVWNGGHNNLAWEICGLRPSLPEFGTVDDLVREIAAMPDAQHIVLSEELDAARPEQVARIRDAFEHFDVRVVVFLRNQLDWLQAMFGEEQKWIGATTFDDWLAGRVDCEPRIDLEALCSLWREAFGRISIRCYEAIRSNVFAHFLDCCDAPDGLRAALAPRSVAIVNATPGELPLALIHKASKRAERGGIRPDFFNAHLTPAMFVVAKILGRYERTQSAVSREAAETLYPIMRSSNRRLAERFEVDLGPQYLEPVLPDAATDAAPMTITLNDLNRIVIAIACGMGMKATASLRAIGLAAAQQDPELERRIGEAIGRFAPWDQARDIVPQLDALLMRTMVGGGSALYVERKESVATAYSRIDGIMHPLQELDADGWSDLLVEIHARAGFPPVVPNLRTAPADNFPLRQGHLEFDDGVGARRLSVRHAMTGDGEIVVIDAGETEREPATALERAA